MHSNSASSLSILKGMDKSAKGVAGYLGNEGIEAGLPLHVLLLHHAHALGSLIQGPQISTLTYAAGLQPHTGQVNVQQTTASLACLPLEYH